MPMVEPSAQPVAVKCPRCGSDQLTAQKKGFSAGKAALGAVAVGGLGLLAGGHGSGGVVITCLACGLQWPPGRPPRFTRFTEAEKRAAKAEGRQKVLRSLPVIGLIALGIIMILLIKYG